MLRIIKLLTIVLFVGFSIQSFGQTFSNASEYLDFVGSEQEEITKNMWRYTKALAHSKNDRNISSKRKALLKTMEGSIAKIEKADGYDGDAYKNNVLQHMRLNESLLNNDYAKIVDMKEVAEQSYDLMEAYMIAQEMADKKMQESQLDYETHFYAYANKHNINIIESDTDLGKKMKISNAVFKHYNKMYLIYFKVYINEIYLMQALNDNDVSAIQQNANALSQSAKEGIEVLKAVETYKNDNSLIDVTTKTFEFFIDEAENKIPQLVDFLILNADFETIKTSLEKTPERKRTKEQVDTYNKKIKDLNKAVKAYNKLNQELNTDRQTVINSINMANEKFLARHIPND